MAPPEGSPVHPSAGSATSAVDAHHHLWDPTDAGQDWLGADGHEVLRRRFTADDLRDAAAGGVDGRPVGASVVVQSIADAAETLRLLAVADTDPLVAGVVGWVDLTGDVVGQLDALAAAPGGDRLVGVRHLVQDEPDASWLLRADVLRGLRVLAARGLAYDLLVRTPQRGTGVEAVRRLPGLRVVLDHAGKPDLTRGGRGPSQEALPAWGAQVRALAEVEGTVAKVSGLVTEADPDWRPDDLRRAWDLLLDAFGPDRLAFGSDWPVCLLAATWRRWADVAADLAGDLSPTERDALFGGTARTVYSLPARPDLPAALAPHLENA